jgi:hypothetical protein
MANGAPMTERLMCGYGSQTLNDGIWVKRHFVHPHSLYDESPTVCEVRRVDGGIFFWNFSRSTSGGTGS